MSEANSVLIVDDDESVGDSLNLLLECAGIDASYVQSGAHLMTAIEDESPRVIITDLFMPGSDGLDVIRNARKADPDIKLIVMSGQPKWGGMDWMRIATLLGADECISKIEMSTAIVPLVRRLLEDSRACNAKPLFANT